jgi:GTP-binding protein YchF
MALNCGIIGLTNTGKTTIFNCVSNTKAEITDFAFSTNKSNIGLVKVKDPRMERLVEIQPTQKVVHATIELVDIPGLAKGASQGEGMGNSFLADIRNTDALIHVLRCFEDENLPHIEGSIDPVRDIELVEFELQVKDLETLQKKFEKVKKMLKTGDKAYQKEHDALERMIAHLEELQSIRSLELNDEEKRLVRELSLLTATPVLYVCNVDEDSATGGNDYVKSVEEFLVDQDAKMLVVAGSLEAEVAELEDEDDRKAFLEDAGLTEPSVNKVVRAAYDLLQLDTFFTIGEKENRAWTIKKGATAPEAAGAIHSDLQKGFIRAEVIAYEDIDALGSEQACKEAGKHRLEGKTYIVQNGDLLNIRFNV